MLKTKDTAKINTSGNAATATKLQTARKINGVSFDGTSDINININSSNQLAFSTTRPTSANSAITTGPSMVGFLATGNMTTGKPHTDGYITEYRWDTDAGWSSQFFVPSNGNGKLQFREMVSGTWGDWNTVYSTNNKPTADEIGAAREHHDHPSYIKKARDGVVDGTTYFNTIEPYYVNGANFQHFDLEFQDEDSGDIVWKHPDGTQKGRIWHDNSKLLLSGTSSNGSNLLTINSELRFNGNKVFHEGSPQPNVNWANGASYADKWVTNAYGSCELKAGTGDNATFDSHNVILKTHWGLGIRDYQDICRILFDARRGSLVTHDYIQTYDKFWGNGLINGSYGITLGVHSYTTGDYALHWEQATADNGAWFPTLRPGVSNFAQLGSSARRWRAVWCNQSSMNTSSDRRLKEDIAPMSKKVENLFMDLKPVQYRFKDDYDDNRLHNGFIAQEVEEAMQKHGIEYNDFSALLKFKPEKGEEPNFLDENGEADYEYGLGYGEFTALNTHMIQKALNKIEELENKIKVLENK